MKNRMAMIALMVICMGTIKAQFIVNDPLNYAQIGLVIDEGMKQTKALKTSLDLMKSTKESVDKVSSLVKALEDVEKIASLSEEMLSNSSKMMERLKRLDGLPASHINNALAECLNYNTRITRSVLVMTDLLTDNRYKVNDYERITLFKEQLREMERISLLMNQQNQSLNRIEAKMQLFKAF